MNFCDNIDSLKIEKPVVTIGTFDGVHLGHQQIIKRLKQKAKEISGTPLIITFWPHPRIVLQQNIESVTLLNTLNEKQKLFRDFGIENVLVCTFTKEFAAMSSLDFVKNYLIDKIKIKAIIFGYDHHFGKNREGNYETLKNYAEEWKFEIEKVEEYREGLTNISSTSIRKSLLSGNLHEANVMLGYNYFIEGNVVGGMKLGREIGFPTANIKLNDELKLIPKEGVYAIKIIIEDKYYNGVLNIGRKPTIVKNHLKPTIEAHIFGFNDDIYEKKVKVELIEYIREEQKFNSLDELKLQIEKDILKSKLILSA